jgi:hypothetical protein
MSLTEKILNDKAFKSLADKVPADEREKLEISIRDMLSSAERFYEKILEAANTEEGREQLGQAIEPLISPPKVSEDVEK